MSRSDAAQTEENKPMWRWLVLPMVVLACLAATALADAPRDRDHDRLPDRWERKHHLSPTTPSARRDPDGDHLMNRRELRLRTHPRRADTDRDRLRDRAEVRRFHTNPRKRDTDGDRFSDSCELRKGTNPRKRRSHPRRRCAKSPQAPPRHLAPAPPAPGPAPPGGSPTATGGWPDASNTGVPAGRVLVPSGSMTITEAGAVIDGRDITGPVEVRAPNVTIRNSRITSNSMYVVYNWSTNLTIEDSELVDGPDTGQNNCHNGVGDSSFTVRRTEITGCENAANFGGDNITFADNYIHDLDTTGPSHVWGMDPHTDGLQMSPGADNIVVRHNWIDPSPGGNVTAPIIMGVHGSQNNVWIEDNYLDGTGASYALYANRSPSTNVNINRNRMRKGYGYTACVRLGVTVSTFNGNVDDVTGAPLSPDNGFDGGCSN
jgi:hypothetical protein